MVGVDDPRGRCHVRSEPDAPHASAVLADDRRCTALRIFIGSLGGVNSREGSGALLSLQVVRSIHGEPVGAPQKKPTLGRGGYDGHDQGLQFRQLVLDCRRQPVEVGQRLAVGHQSDLHPSAVRGQGDGE